MFTRRWKKQHEEQKSKINESELLPDEKSQTQEQLKKTKKKTTKKKATKKTTKKVSRKS